jgi:hypothetical protein
VACRFNLRWVITTNPVRGYASIRRVRARSSCALDVADSGAHEPKAIARIMRITIRQAQQLLRRATRALAASDVLEDFASDLSVPQATYAEELEMAASSVADRRTETGARRNPERQADRVDRRQREDDSDDNALLLILVRRLGLSLSQAFTVASRVRLERRSIHKSSPNTNDASTQKRQATERKVAE